MFEEHKTSVFNPDQFKFCLNWTGMVANKYIPIEHILSAFDHQNWTVDIWQIFGNFIFITKYPGEAIKWEQTLHIRIIV